MEIGVSKFNEYLKKNNVALICGNGFSINFDKCFNNIYSRLYTVHKLLIKYSEYEVFSNKEFSTKLGRNYNNIKMNTKNISKKKFYKIFTDGVLFANSIIENKSLIKELTENGYIRQLIFDKSELHLVIDISRIAKEEDISKVNIENWPILIYFYYAIKNINTLSYSFPDNNEFIRMIRVGNIDKTNLFKERNIEIDSQQGLAYSNTIFNGFFIYYKMLFSIAIFAEGKAINLNLLEGINNLDIDKIRKFLKGYKHIFSLNYDHIIENILDDKIDHLHGEYIIDEKEYFYHQRFGMIYNKKYISFSNMIIGDYFIAKTEMPLLMKFSSNKGKNGTAYMWTDIIESKMETKQIDTIVLFGVNIENDEILIRELIYAFEKNNISNPSIIYCYFNENEKINFNKKYSELNNFSKDLTEYGKGISILHIDTKELLKEYFYK